MVEIQSLDSHTVQSLLKESLVNALSCIQRHLEDFLRTKDAESLHQYRVHIRTARSLCKEFGSFMEKNRKKLFDEQLKRLQQETNAMRDIDVFLECIDAYERQIDASCLIEFQKLRQTLLEEKANAYTVFCEKYTQENKILTQLQEALKDERLCLPKSQEKMLKYLKNILEERLEKIAKLSKKLDENSANERFHKLRLHYKKLRYTCDAVHFKDFAKRFKPVQSAFGHVQDKNTQIERIKYHDAQNSACLAQIIALLEEELKKDKRACVELSSDKSIQKLSKTLQKLFTT